MNIKIPMEHIEYMEALKTSFDHQVQIAKLLDEFRETRSIATATEICDLMLGECSSE